MRISDWSSDVCSSDLENDEADDRQEGADHVDVAVGEVDHTDDAVDHRLADGDWAINGAQRQVVDQLLNEVFHRLCLAPLKSRASTEDRKSTRLNSRR